MTISTRPLPAPTSPSLPSLFLRNNKVLSQLSGHDVTDAAIPPELVQLLNDRAAGNPKHIMEMIKALMKDDACGEDGGPAIAVMPNGRVKILTRRLYEVPVPEKMRGAIRQEFEQLSPSHQQILKLATPFKSFTPGMLLDAYLADKQLDHSFSSEEEQFARFRRECEELCDMGVLEARNSTLYVAQYFPRDMNECNAYHFLSKLLQEEVHKLIPGIWKQTLESTVNSRLSKVLRAIVQLQQYFRKRLMRRSFAQLRVGQADPKEFITRAFSRPSLTLDARMTPNTSVTGDSSDLMSPARSSPSDAMYRRRSSIMSVDEETLAQLQEEYEKGLKNAHVHIEEDVMMIGGRSDGCVCSSTQTLLFSYPLYPILNLLSPLRFLLLRNQRRHRNRKMAISPLSRRTPSIRKKRSSTRRKEAKT